jgi:hypothetical protein
LSARAAPTGQSTSDCPAKTWRMRNSMPHAAPPAVKVHAFPLMSTPPYRAPLKIFTHLPGGVNRTATYRGCGPRSTCCGCGPMSRPSPRVRPSCTSGARARSPRGASQDRARDCRRPRPRPGSLKASVAAEDEQFRLPRENRREMRANGIAPETPQAPWNSRKLRFGPGNNTRHSNSMLNSCPGSYKHYC